MRISPREARQFAVLGCLRSGTGYMAALFQAFGYDVRHESVKGKDGACSWSLVPDTCFVSPEVRNFHRQQFAFTYIVHVLRDPLKAVSSIYSKLDVEDWWSFATEYVPIWGEKGSLEAVIQLVVGWNKLIKAMGPDVVIKVEEAPRRVASFLHSLRLRGSRGIEGIHLPPTNVNTKGPVHYYSAEELKELVEPVVFNLLMEMGDEYGYEIGSSERRMSS